MSQKSANDKEHEILDEINNRHLDYFEFESFGTSRQIGDDVLVINCCWSDGAPHHVFYKLRFHEVAYIGCAIFFHEAFIRLATEPEIKDLRKIVDFGEFDESMHVYCVETNRLDKSGDSDATSDFKSNKHFVVAKWIELEAGEMQRHPS